MSDDAIRQAAERANSLVGDYCLQVTGQTGKYYTRQDDEWRIRQAWLAANDQTPVDVAWLESVLAGQDRITAFRFGELLCISDSKGGLYCVDGHARAEVFGLLTWLRVPLAERTEQPR